MVPRIDNIALGLRHFLAFCIENESERKTALVADGIEDCGGDGQQRVKPASGLVDTFADVVDWEVLLQLLSSSERVMPLCEESATRVEPAVHHVGLPNHLAAASIGLTV